MPNRTSPTSGPRTTWPTISLAMATFNSARTLRESLQSVKAQDYPSEVEIIVADGGSSDQSLTIAKQYGAKIHHVPIDKQNAEYNKGIAVSKAKNEVLLMIDHDNILPHKNWLRNMVRPLMDNPKIIGAGCLRFAHEPGMTLLDRYFALIGAPDPVPFFLNKSAHQSWLYDDFHLRGKLLADKGPYFLVELNPDKMPALGGNGCVLRRALLREAKSDPDNFFHIDIHVDLAIAGYRTYAFVKETIKHLSNNSLLHFLARRRYFIEKYHFLDYSRRRYSIYEPNKDKLRLLGYIIYSATFIGPLVDATRGYLKVQDFAWFLHPVMCFAMLVVYGVPTLKEESKRVFLAK